MVQNVQDGSYQRERLGTGKQKSDLQFYKFTKDTELKQPQII